MIEIFKDQSLRQIVKEIHQHKVPWRQDTIVDLTGEQKDEICRLTTACVNAPEPEQTASGLALILFVGQIVRDHAVAGRRVIQIASCLDSVEDELGELTTDMYEAVVSLQCLAYDHRNEDFWVERGVIPQ